MTIGDADALPLPVAYELVGEISASTDAFVSAFREEYPSVQAFEEWLANLRGRPGSLFLVAFERDDPLGFLVVEPRRQAKLSHTAELHMGVREGARGRGVGGRLLAAARERLRGEGIIEIVYLMVRADNAPARRLYERHGFTALATLERDTKIGERYFDGVLMRTFIGEDEGT